MEYQGLCSNQKMELNTGKNNNMEYINNCRVCGFFMKDPPWGVDGKSPNYEICPCCGVEFGNEDYTVESTKEYRNKWLSKSIRFCDKDTKPKDWDFEKQMRNLPKDYR